MKADDPIERLQQAITTLEQQRPLLGDAAANTALASLQQALAEARAAQAADGVSAQPVHGVSVLVLDIVGSTALSQHLDPEQTHEIMDGTLARLSEQVQAHGGQVLQYAGDNLVAAFGHRRPAAQSDGAMEAQAEGGGDPEVAAAAWQAVCAGLALLRVGAEQGRWVLARHGRSGFDVRLGIHTGPVLLGGRAAGEARVRGQTVALASKLEQGAPVAGMHISHATWSCVQQRLQPPFRVTPAGEVVLAGLALLAYRVWPAAGVVEAPPR